MPLTFSPPHWAAAQGGSSSVWPGNLSSHGKRDCWKGQTGEGVRGCKRTAKGTLLLSDIGFTNVTEEPGVSRAAMRIVRPGFVQAQLAIYSQSDIRSVAVFLAIVFPPANRAQPQRTGGLESLVSTARAAIKGCDSFHNLMDEKKLGHDYRKSSSCPIHLELHSDERGGIWAARNQLCR